MDLYKFTYNLLSIKGIGRVKANKIISMISHLVKENKVIYDNVKENLKTFLSQEDIEYIFKEQEYGDLDVKYLTIIDKGYPLNLKKLNTNAPTIISYIGNIELLKNKTIGFCGARKASDNGLNVAEDISKQVSKKNITIVSGYASGIDQKTHYEALKNGGSTIIVIPNGINKFKIKKDLKEVWDWNRILVISEFRTDAIWSASRAMQRNSTIIALSNIMILIEAKEKGGSIDAGYKTLNSKKPLYAPVYKDYPEIAKGNQILLEKGALPLKKKRTTMRANLDSIFEYLKKIDESNNLFE